MKQRTYFNEKIDSYESIHETYMKTKNKITDCLKNTPKKILDLGVGTGLEFIHLFEKYPDVKVTAIDISDNMINELKKKSFANNVNTICGDFF